MGPALRACALFLACFAVARAVQRFAASGIVVKVDQEGQTLTVSHESIPGYMDAMVMPFHVADPKALQGIQPGMKVAFTLVVGKEASAIDGVRVVTAVPAAREQLELRRLRELTAARAAARALRVGEPVPGFELTDQERRPVRLSQFSGKVVVVTFIYTRCPLPDYCLRLSNNFARLQRRFAQRMGRDLELLSITFDPQNDTPEALAAYAARFKYGSASWRFLTGPADEIRRISGLFGVDYFPDEGTLEHTLRTAVIGREGRLAATVEGNQFSFEQLGDLVQAVLDESGPGSRR